MHNLANLSKNLNKNSYLLLRNAKNQITGYALRLGGIVDIQFGEFVSSLKDLIIRRCHRLKRPHSKHPKLTSVSINRKREQLRLKQSKTKLTLKAYTSQYILLIVLYDVTSGEFSLERRDFSRTGSTHFRPTARHGPNSCLKLSRLGFFDQQNCAVT